MQLFKVLEVIVWVCKFCFDNIPFKAHEDVKLISVRDERGSQVVLMVKNPPANAGAAEDAGLIPGLRRSPGGGHGNLLQCSCPENPRDSGA